jgi:hypothetical protein
MSFGDSLRKALENELLDNRNERADNAVKRGQYTVMIEEARAAISKNDDEYAVVKHKILEGPIDGMFEHYLGLSDKNPVGKSINTNALAAYGVNLSTVEDIHDLDLQMSALVGTKAEIGVSWNDKGWMQVNVHRSWAPEPRSDIPTNGDATPPAASDAQASFAAAAGAKADDDIPF